MIRTVLERIEASPDFDVGKPRDVTINKRHSGFFRLGFLFLFFFFLWLIFH